MVSAGISLGGPPPTAACRAGACPAPPCSTCPMRTYSTSSTGTPERSRAAWMATAPSSVASLSLSAPPSLPKGVRTAETMTERAIGASVPTGSRPTARSVEGGGRLAESRVLREPAAGAIREKGHRRDDVAPASDSHDRLVAIRITGRLDDVAGLEALLLEERARDADRIAFVAFSAHRIVG